MESWRLKEFKKKKKRIEVNTYVTWISSKMDLKVA